MEIVSAVANPARLRTPSDLTYMQDMTHDICANTKDSNGNTNITPGNEVTKQLIDVRDGKKYWVSKLADQNCWMTQNLAYDITQERIDNNEINPSNTDVSEVWNESSAYPPVPTWETTKFDLSNDPNGTNSWNLGNYMITDSATNFVSCTGLVGGVAFNPTTCSRLKEYDDNAINAHYLLGNYYQFNAATAGTGGNNTNSEAAHFTQKLVQQQI